MMRFLIGLLVAVTVYFGWQWYSQPAQGEALHPVAGLLEKAGSGRADGSGPAGAATKPLQAGAAAQSGVNPRSGANAQPGAKVQDRRTPASASGSTVLRGLLAADAAAFKIGFRELQDADEPLRSRIREALVRAGESATDVDARLRVLGAGNAFLRADSGRKLAQEVLRDIRRMDPEKAIVRSTALLENCVRGPLEKEHKAAYDLVNEVYRFHRILVDQVSFNPARVARARSHKVRSGETLNGIAAKYCAQGIDVEGWTLCYANRIGRPSRLMAGKTIKIPVEPFSVRIEKESFAMMVYLGKTIVRLYWVGHGKEGSPTPETTFTIADKVPDPDWNAPDGNTYPFGHPKNVLGRYFVKFGHDSLHGFGAHGTSEPQSIRTRSSLGCIRMKDPDIEEFFRLVPRGSKVVVAATR